MASSNRSQRVTQVHDLLKKRYKPDPAAIAAKLTILEATVFGICHENTTEDRAAQALARFKEGFFDWNEVRVSAMAEIELILRANRIPHPVERAQVIRRFLRQLFEKTYGFNLDALLKKPFKDALKTLREYEAFQSEFVTAVVIQKALGGHAIPIDANIKRALLRLDLVDPKADVPSMRGSLEHAIPKTRGLDFHALVERLALDVCVEPEPDCPRCDLRKICPTGIARMSAPKGKAPKAAATAAKPEPAPPTKPTKPPTKPQPAGKAAPSAKVEALKPAPKAETRVEPAKPAPKAATAKPAPKASVKPAPKAAPKTAAPKATKPTPKAAAKPAPKAATPKATPKAAAKSAAKASAKPATKPAPKPAPSKNPKPRAR